MTKLILAIVGAVALIFLGSLFVTRPTTPAVLQSVNIEDKAVSTPSTQLQKAPDFSLQDYSGKTMSLADFSGKPLIINSWAAWCPFCKKELSDFVTVQKEFGDKVVFIAIDRAEPLDVAKKYTDELGVTDDLVLLLDSQDSFYQSIGGFSMPETIFVDKDGFIKFHKRGPMEVEEIRNRVQQLVSISINYGY